jgi:hypothetical protein
VTWFLHTKTFIMHDWMTVLFLGLLALLIFLIAVLDNPYRGKISVSPEPNRARLSANHVTAETMTRQRFG